MRDEVLNLAKRISGQQNILVLPRLFVDLTVEYGTDWEKAKFDELMASRFANARPTVLTTNKDITDLPSGIRSRFEDRRLSRVAYNSAGDYRKRRRN